MARSFVFAVIGPDRPGLVELMSDVVVTHEGNWLDSRMASLGDQFVGVARITVPDAKADAFSAALKRLETSGLRVMLEPVAAVTTTEAKKKLAIKLMGHDRPGIVREISRVLNRHRVNISELNTGTVAVPMSGDIYFRAAAELDVPADLAFDKLKADLEALSHEIMVDLEVEERDG